MNGPRVSVVGPPGREDMFGSSRLLEFFKTLSEGSKFKTECEMLEFEPGGADTQGGPPGGDVIEGG